MKRIAVAVLLTLGILLFFAFAAFMLLVRTAPMSRTEFVATYIHLKAFKWGFAELDDAGRKTLYKWSCVAVCHGAEPIENSRHTSREWRSIVDRMRVKNGASINKREEDAIVKYLEKNHGSNVPTILSPEADKYLKRFLWKSDFGESDLYVDIIYSPVEYFDIMGGSIQGKEYEAGKYLVFMVYLNTHQGQLDPWKLERLATLKGPDGAVETPIDWRVIYESGDKHHLEGVLRFEKGAEAGTGSMEMTLRDLPGQKERVFMWDLPIPQFRK